MFVDLLSANSCCNVVASRTWYLTDIRGKRVIFISKWYALMTIATHIYLG